MDWYLKVVRDNYANFSGRARLKEYWMFYLFHILIILLLFILSTVVSELFDTGVVFIIIGLYVLATIIPSLAVAVRRLHDTGKSGWYYLFSLIPYVGRIIMIVFTVTEGDAGPNKYGPDPKSNYQDEINEIGTTVE